MFSELTSFMEKLQEAANSNTRLEAENESLRQQLDAAKAQVRPGVEAEIAGLRRELDDLRLRLSGAEEARNAAVEARMRAEQAAANRSEELLRLRSEIGDARMAQQAAESQAEARKRQAIDAAKALRAVVGALES